MADVKSDKSDQKQESVMMPTSVFGTIDWIAVSDLERCSGIVSVQPPQCTYSALCTRTIITRDLIILRWL